MVEDNKQVTKYKTAIEFMKFDREYLWKSASIFLIVHTVFLALIFQTIVGKTLVPGPMYGGNFTASCVGLTLCFVWYVINKRGLDIYRYRRIQVKNAEIEGWNLLEGNGNDANPLNSDELIEDFFMIPNFVFALFYIAGIIIIGDAWTA